MGLPIGQLAANVRIKTISGGTKTISSAGTAEIIVSNEFCTALVVQALESNTTQISVGGSDTLATAASENGIFLDSGETVTFYLENSAIIYMDALTNGEGCSYVLLFG
jgi:hypothetical protein